MSASGRGGDALVSLTATIALLVPAVLSACSPAPTDLQAQLRDTGLTLYLPEVAGRLPVRVADEVEPGVTDLDPATSSPGPRPQEEARPTAVDVTDGTVVVTYTRTGGPAYELVLMPAPDGPLCAAVPQIAGSQCVEERGVMRSSMEELAKVAVQRGGTLLVLDGLVRETHPDLVDIAVAILQDAPEVSPEDLAAADS